MPAAAGTGMGMGGDTRGYTRGTAYSHQITHIQYIVQA
jgi:hypothetical protein